LILIGANCASVIGPTVSLLPCFSAGLVAEGFSMDIKVGDWVRTVEGHTATVSVISGDSIYVNVKTDLGSYIQVVHISDVAKIDPPETPTA
jgi:hypothetical protein